MVPSFAWRSRLIIACVVLALCACDSSATPAPSTRASGAAASGAPAQSAPDGTPNPLRTGGPGGGSPGPDPDAEPALRDLPVPTISEPFAIGQALYDQTQMADAVMSVLTLMGVGIYRDDGTPIDTGAVTKAGDPWLFQSEVLGLIDMGIEDIGEATDDGPTYRLKDLYDALHGTLAPDVSLDAFIGAYTNSYAANPTDLVPSVMLGQPVDASTPLTRVQLWLLYMDAFVDLAPPSTADVRQGAVAAAPRPRSGTANAALPPLSQPQSLSANDWSELLPHFMTIVNKITFTFNGSDGHEGHGGLGQPVKITARILAGKPFVSPITGNVLLQAGSGPLDGLEVRWRSPDIPIYNEHGTLAAAIPGATNTDSTGRATITYTPKREVANGQGALTHDVAKISASASALDLLLRAYRIDDQSVLAFVRAGTLGQRRTLDSDTLISWHGPGIEVTLENAYDVTVNAADGIGGLVAVAHRAGNDSFTGTLVKRSDGTYRGILLSQTAATSNMAFGAGGLVGDRCDDSTNISQSLTVVGTLKPTTPGIDADLEVPGTGVFGGQDLVLTFTPDGAPSDEGTCQRSVPYFATNPSGIRVIAAWYASFSDERITDPSLGGYRIHLPEAGQSLEYADKRQAKENLPVGAGVNSIWTITVARQPGS